MLDKNQYRRSPGREKGGQRREVRRLLVKLTLATRSTISILLSSAAVIILRSLLSHWRISRSWCPNQDGQISSSRLAIGVHLIGYNASADSNYDVDNFERAARGVCTNRRRQDKQSGRGSSAHDAGMRATSSAPEVECFSCHKIEDRRPDCPKRGENHRNEGKEQQR